MRRRVFKAEKNVAIAMLVIGVVAMPALIWSGMIEDRSLIGFYADFYRILFTFDYEWWVALIALFVPVIVFECACTFVWAVMNRRLLWQVLKPTRFQKRERTAQQGG
jgi:hypothetical protein